MDRFADIVVPTPVETIAMHAAARPDAAAIRFEERAWSYAALDAHVARVAAALLRRAAPGDRIGYLGRNSDLVALIALGALRAGMIFVPVNWRLSPGEIADILADAAPSLVFAAPGHEPADRATVPAAAVLDEAWLGASDAALPPIDPHATAVLMYTSGTTGVPKGVMLSHRALNGTNAMRQRHPAEWDDWGPDDVTLVCLPLSHIGGFGLLVRSLFFGGEAVIHEVLEPGAILGAVEHQRVSKLALVPTAIRMVIDHPRSGAVDYSRIGTMVYGASSITLDLLRDAIATFGCRFAQSYGMSETSATIAILPPDDHDVEGTPRMRSAGLALPGTEIRIVGDDGRDLPAGETGEIVVRTIGAMTGYWRMPDVTAQVLGADGWYRTGDAGYLDADGYLFIKDRVKDMIVSGAENVYPAEVENVLAAHPDVGQVAVIGVPDDLWGEAVKAVVVAAPGRRIDPDEVIAWSRTQIAHFKAPRSIDVVDSLPLNATGKVRKDVLRARYKSVAAEIVR